MQLKQLLKNGEPLQTAVAIVNPSPPSSPPRSDTPAHLPAAPTDAPTISSLISSPSATISASSASPPVSSPPVVSLSLADLDTLPKLATVASLLQALPLVPCALDDGSSGRVAQALEVLADIVALTDGNEENMRVLGMGGACPLVTNVLKHHNAEVSVTEAALAAVRALCCIGGISSTIYNMDNISSFGISGACTGGCIQPFCAMGIVTSCTHIFFSLPHFLPFLCLRIYHFSLCLMLTEVTEILKLHGRAKVAGANRVVELTASVVAILALDNEHNCAALVHAGACPGI